MKAFAAMAAPLLLVAGAAQFSLTYADRVTFDDLRFTEVVRQQTEPSCATASIATIIRLRFGEALDEAALWLGYVGELPTEQQRIAFSQGLSIRDITSIVERHGYKAHAVRIGLMEMAKSGQPAIVFLERKGPVPFRHFVVFRKLSGTDVQLLDPAQGKRQISISEFRRYWSGVAVFVERK